jgi:outer membrane protein
LNIAGQSITKSEYDLNAAKSDFVLAVSSAYYDALKAKKSLEIAAANMERLTQYRTSVEKRVKVGDLTKTALLRAEGELSGARSDYLKATNALRLARAALIMITGIEDDFRLKETPLPAEEEMVLNNLKSVALESRADLKSFDVQMKIAAEQVKYARGAFWPNIGLFAIYNGSDQYPASGSSATQTLNRETVLAGVSLTFPFFEGGLRMAELREAKARERQAKLAYDDFKKSVGMELQSAYLDVLTQKGTLKFLEDQLVFAEDNYNAVLRQFENGLATSLDVMDANSLLLGAERNVAEALYNYQLALLKVKRSIGKLLQFVTAGN